MRPSNFIWIFCLIGAVTYQVAGQDVVSMASEEQLYLERAMRDADHEHNMRFSRHADEVDFWNDQRDFEQKLFQSHSGNYKAYLYGKHLAYLSHREDCSSECGHGDYYRRQASFYSQFNSRNGDTFLTLTRLEDDLGWEVSLISTRRNQ